MSERDRQDAGRSRGRRWGRGGRPEDEQEQVSGEELGWLDDLRTAKAQRGSIGPGDDQGPAGPPVPVPPAPAAPAPQSRAAQRPASRFVPLGGTGESPALPRALDWAATVALADEALYAVKRAGRNGWEGVTGIAGAVHGVDVAGGVAGDVTDLEGALRQRSRGSMADWLASGDLKVVRSSPPADAGAAVARPIDAGKS